MAKRLRRSALLRLGVWLGGGLMLQTTGCDLGAVGQAWATSVLDTFISGYMYDLLNVPQFTFF